MTLTMLFKSLKSLIGTTFRITSTRKFSVCSALFDVARPRVGIVGSGPAGFYTAQYIIKHHKTAVVDIFEKLPVPFGLVRYGVAPDHPEMKNATNSFEEVANDNRCRFFGNVNIGRDVKATDLSDIYDGIVFAYGADDDKHLNIPGEDAEGVIAARSFVGWYNGLPAHADLEPNLNCETAVIIGQGNVALDVARILLTPIEDLEHTDICHHALESLKRSQVKRVVIVGRRGPYEVSFTIKEVREMTRLAGTKPIFHAGDFEHVRSGISDVPRQRRRLMELMCKTALDEPSANDAKRFDFATKEWELAFLKTPVEILHGNGHVTGIRLERNALHMNDGRVDAVGTGETEDISCGLVLRSIGYKSIPLQEGIPFDKRLGIIPNIDGRVVSHTGSSHVIPGLYVSGWVKHGPVGVIATTMNEAFSTAQNIVQDLNEGIVAKQQTGDVTDILKQKGVHFVTFDDYQKIDTEEMFRGEKSSKPREKIVSADEMLNIAHDEEK